MIEIKTYVYFDLESTGLMKTNPKITELTFIAVSPMDLSGENVLHIYLTIQVITSFAFSAA